MASAAPVTPWRPAGISSPQFESHAAFDPRTGDFYFVRSSPEIRRLADPRQPVRRQRGWSEPEPPAFAGEGVEADPYFTRDGDTLYYISTRSTDGVSARTWTSGAWIGKAGGVWGTPLRLPEPLNSTSTEWFPRPSPDGWLYFGSNRPGGLGGNDIWRARGGGPMGAGRVENLGPAINTAGDEYEPLPSPDGERMIVMADGGLYETRERDGDGWSPRVKLPRGVNSTASEIGAVFSPSGRSLLFSRDTKGPDSGEFFVFREGDPEPWPPECPSPSPSPR